MVKSIISFAAITLFILFATSGGKNPAESKVGNLAPNMALVNSDTAMTLQQLRGRYVVITFWNSSQPQTRIANMRHDRLAQSGQFTHVAINTDRSERVFDELCRIDGLDTSLEFHIDARQPLLREWKQDDEHLDTFVISPDGTILSVNPVDETLLALGR